MRKVFPFAFQASKSNLLPTFEGLPWVDRVGERWSIVDVRQEKLHQGHRKSVRKLTFSMRLIASLIMRFQKFVYQV